MDIVLHQFNISPFCGKVRRILRYKGLEFRTEEYGGFKALAAKRLSPVGKLPVLEYAGQLVQDSSVIARFLEQRHPSPSLIPGDPRDAHLAMVLEDWADESLYWYEVYFRFMYPESADRAFSILQKGRPTYEKKLMLALAVPALKQQLKAQGIGKYPKDAVEAQFREHLQHLEGLLTEREWLVGDSCSIADIAVASQLLEIRLTSHLSAEFRRYPALSRWLDRLE